MKLANSRALTPLMLLILLSTAALTACGGGASGGAANNAGPSAVVQSPGAVPAVSLAMDDYLGRTVVLYFSFPG